MPITLFVVHIKVEGTRRKKHSYFLLCNHTCIFISQVLLQVINSIKTSWGPNALINAPTN